MSFSVEEGWRLFDELESHGFIERSNSQAGDEAKITSKGIQYVEKESFSENGRSVVQIFVNIHNEFHQTLQNSGLNEEQIRSLVELLQSKDEKEVKKKKLSEQVKSFSVDALKQIVVNLLSDPTKLSTLVYP